MTGRSLLDSRKLGVNTLWALVGEGAQLIVGSAAFFLLVDRLGPVEAGYYGSVLAVATLGIPLASVGSQALLLRDVSAGFDFDTLWSRSVLTVFFGGVAVTVLATLLLQPWLLPELPSAAFALIFFAQAALFAVAEFGLVAAQVHRRLEVGALIRIVTGLCRLAAVVFFAVRGGSTVATWSLFAAGSFSVAAIASLAIVRFSFGSSPFGSLPTPDSLRRGAPFAFGAGSARTLDSLDRPMLVRLGPNPVDAGVYNVGYRLAQMALLPVGALVRSSEAQIYDAGASSRQEALSVAQRLSVRAAVYGAGVGLVMVLCAPIVPLVLGDEWHDVVAVVRYLALLPVLKAVQVFPANALSASGGQAVRNKVLLAAIVLNAALNLWLIPVHGWRGAAIATVLAEAAMSFGLWAFLLRDRQRSRG